MSSRKAAVVAFGCFLSACTIGDVVESLQLGDIALEYEEGEYERVVLRLNAFLAKHPDHDLAWTMLGNAYEELDRDMEARDAYERALVINPKRVEAITGIGILHRKAGDSAAAMQAYQDAVAVDPEYAPAYSSMSIIALKQYDDSLALSYAERAHKLDPSDPVIAANLSAAYHYNGLFERRDEMAARAAKLGYPRMQDLEEIFEGSITVRDEAHAHPER